MNDLSNTKPPQYRATRLIELQQLKEKWIILAPTFEFNLKKFIRHMNLNRAEGTIPFSYNAVVHWMPKGDNNVKYKYSAIVQRALKGYRLGKESNPSLPIRDYLAEFNQTNKVDIKKTSFISWWKQRVDCVSELKEEVMDDTSDTSDNCGLGKRSRNMLEEATTLEEDLCDAAETLLGLQQPIPCVRVANKSSNTLIPRFTEFDEGWDIVVDDELLASKTDHGMQEGPRVVDMLSVSEESSIKESSSIKEPSIVEETVFKPLSPLSMVDMQLEKLYTAREEVNSVLLRLDCIAVMLNTHT